MSNCPRFGTCGWICLGESDQGRLIQIELQSGNDSDMALRMLEYSAAVRRQFGRFAEQVVLYVGEAPLRMTGRLTGPGLLFECRIVDIRELDGEHLLQSERLEDNIIAVPARVSEPRAAVKKVLSSIAAADASRRARALAGFLTLAGLRRLEETIEREARRMPLLDDIMDNRVLGREYRRGEAAVVARLIEKRFGNVPAELRERLAEMSAAGIEAVGLRVLEAGRVEDLLG